MPVSGVHLISLSPLPYKLCVFFFLLNTCEHFSFIAGTQKHLKQCQKYYKLALVTETCNRISSQPLHQPSTLKSRSCSEQNGGKDFSDAKLGV